MNDIPKRWIMALMLFTGLAILYTLRVNMSIAAQQMRIDLNWTEKQKGYVLSSFYWGYLSGQIPASLITQKYGAKWLFGLSIAIPSFLTILVPAICQYSYEGIIIIRVLIGFFESSSFPALYHFFPIWISNDEKNFMIPFIVAGIYFGEIIGFSFSGILVESNIYINNIYFGGWQSVFYVFGLLGLFWFPIWTYLVYESPSIHPTIKKDELDYMLSCNQYQLDLQLSTHNDTLHHINNSNNKSNNSSSNNNSNYSNNDEAELKEIMLSNIPRSCSKNSIELHDSRILCDNDNVVDNYNNNDNNIDNTIQDVEINPSSHTHTNGSWKDNFAMNNRLIHRKFMKYNVISANEEVIDIENNNKIVSHNPLINNYSNIMLQQTDIINIKNDDNNRNHNTLHHIPHTQDHDKYKTMIINGTPWKMFFTHPVAICLFIANFQYGWMNFTLTSEMPSYFTDVLGFNIQSAGILCVFPYLALFISALFYGRLFDYLKHQQYWSTNSIRRTAQFIAYFCSGICLIICGYINDYTIGSYTLMIITLIFFGSNQCGLGCVFTDIAPIYSSCLNTIGNTMGALAGILGPIIVAFYTDYYPGINGWRAVFILTFILNCISLILWFLFIKAEIIPELNTPVIRNYIVNNNQ